MDSQKGSNTLIGIAGVHYVVCELSRRGLIALPTTRNTAGYDVIAVTQDGKKHANIQVKTSSHQSPGFWPVATRVESIRRGPADYYVFLSGMQEKGTIQGYLLTGKDVLKEIRQHYRDKAFTAGKPFPYCLHLRDGARDQWEKDWISWTP